MWAAGSVLPVLYAKGSGHRCKHFIESLDIRTCAFVSVFNWIKYVLQASLTHERIQCIMLVRSWCVIQPPWSIPRRGRKTHVFLLAPFVVCPLSQYFGGVGVDGFFPEASGKGSRGLFDTDGHSAHNVKISNLLTHALLAISIAVCKKRGNVDREQCRRNAAVLDALLVGRIPAAPFLYVLIKNVIMNVLPFLCVRLSAYVDHSYSCALVSADNNTCMFTNSPESQSGLHPSDMTC